MPNDDDESVVRFAPPQVKGISGATGIAIHPDRIEVQAEGRWVTFCFRDMARRQEHALARLLKRLFGLRPHPLIVGEREFCTDDRYVVFYSDPPLKVYTPPDPAGYADTFIARINAVLRQGGYAYIRLVLNGILFFRLWRWLATFLGGAMANIELPVKKRSDLEVLLLQRIQNQKVEAYSAINCGVACNCSMTVTNWNAWATDTQGEQLRCTQADALPTI